MIREALIQAGMQVGLASFIDILLGALVAASFGLIWILFGIWVERKMAARIQDRLGPNRVGPFGLVQNVADALKLLTKELIIPRNADRPVYFLAPVLSVVAVVLIAAVLPFSPVVIGTDLSIGILYVIAVGSIGTIAVLMAGWGSNNKYALLGAFRVVAHLVSYEVPMVLSLLVPVLMAGTMSMQGLVADQHIWYIFAVPIAALIFFISSQAEVGRAPFDLLEAESELVAGYNIEYSGMAFAMFYLGEFMHAFFVSILFAVLFLGGWQGPGAQQLPLLGLIYLFIKSMLVYFVQIWLRLTVPRVRIDQLLSFNWKFLVPLAIINVLLVAFLWGIIPSPDYQSFVEIAESQFGGVTAGIYRVVGPYQIAELPRTGIMLVGNIILLAVTAAVLRRVSRQNQGQVESLVDETDYTGGSHSPEAPEVPATAGW